ncbi:UDP-glucose/GDP-mannose dehydrogenase family protein [Bacillus sp. REN10]|uniref:UDP-glucose dehydrogenase family protein n=1 Tax=Bacillus sp. REN10 TaxID=2782541 RepID=UPI001EEF6ED1|nr:UDP-glucose/GDP-mannose dehydrogenase family protein [Bacillus sp. REN10]
MMKKVTVAGMGYVGIVTSVVLAHLGCEVTCLDTDSCKIDQLKKKQLPIFEPGLQTALYTYDHQLTFTNQSQEAMADAELIVIAVGTPALPNGEADLRALHTLADDIGKYATQPGLIVAVKSTVPPGTSQQLKGWIEQAQEKEFSFSVASTPEFLREGTALADAFKGDRLIIGAENKEAAQTLESLYQPLGIPIFMTDLHSAELIKYASNAFLAAKISFINEMARLVEKVGGNIADVATGMGMDQRIGSQFLQAGVGYGGSCFPKDIQALLHVANKHEVQLPMVEAAKRGNERQIDYFINKVKAVASPLAGKQVAVLGLAFKPNTDDMRNAPSISIIEAMLNEGVKVIGYDPAATVNARLIFTDRIHYATSIEEALQNSDAALILTEWPEIKDMSPRSFQQLLKSPLVIDGRNCLSATDMRAAGVQYYSIGQNERM